MMVEQKKALAMHYIKSKEFKLDVISVFPTDLIYIGVGFHPAVRLNRLLRIYRLNEFLNRTIRRTRSVRDHRFAEPCQLEIIDL